MTTFELFAIAAFGGLLSLDSVSVGQFMFSRPIVSATVIGISCGSPESGLIMGVVLEMLALETMPFGASRYLEWSSGAVVASAFLAKQGSISEPTLLVALLSGLATAWLAGSSMVALRRINGSIVAGRRRLLERGDPAALNMVQAAGVLLDFARGALVVLVAISVALPVGRLLLDAIATSTTVNAAVVVALPTAVAIAAAWRMFAAGSRRRILVLAGAILGAALVVGQ